MALAKTGELWQNGGGMETTRQKHRRETGMSGAAKDGRLGEGGDAALQSATDALGNALKTALEKTGKANGGDVLAKIETVYRAIGDNPNVSLSAIAKAANLSERSVDGYVAVLKLAGALRRKDGKRFGTWEILP